MLEVQCPIGEPRRAAKEPQQQSQATGRAAAQRPVSGARHQPGNGRTARDIAGYATGLCRLSIASARSKNVQQSKKAKKATTLLTNLPAAKVHLIARCSTYHEHCHLEGHIAGQCRRTTLAQIYPKGMVDAIMKTIVPQHEWGTAGIFSLGVIDKDKGVTAEDHQAGEYR